MIENTIANKCRFFAKYWGQNILIFQNKLHYVRRLNESEFIRYSTIELTPLSMITDEHAIELSKVGLPDRLFDYLWSKETGNAIAKTIISGRQNNVFYSEFRMVDAFNFLISKGYYVGDGTEVQIGWCVLKTDK